MQLHWTHFHEAGPGQRKGKLRSNRKRNMTGAIKSGVKEANGRCSKRDGEVNTVIAREKCRYEKD